MLKSITIRDVPEETHDELAARTARSGRSLQEYLRGRLIELAARPDPEEWVRRVRDRKRSTGTRLSRDRILEHRDADRRRPWTGGSPEPPAPAASSCFRPGEAGRVPIGQRRPPTPCSTSQGLFRGSLLPVPTLQGADFLFHQGHQLLPASKDRLDVLGIGPEDPAGALIRIAGSARMSEPGSLGFDLLDQGVLELRSVRPVPIDVPVRHPSLP